MGILENLENSWDDDFSWKHENLSAKIFSDFACNDCISNNSTVSQYKTQIAKAIKDRQAVSLKGFIKKEFLPDWQEFIDHVTYGTKEHDEVYVNKLFKKPIKGIAHFWGDLTIVVGKVHNDHFKYFKDYKKTLVDLYEGEMVDVGSITCFSDIDAGATTKHHDDGDVFNLQCIGKVKWEIWDETEYSDREPDQVLYQEPGDMIFVPASLFHRVTSLTPRASLLFGFTPKR